MLATFSHRNKLPTYKESTRLELETAHFCPFEPLDETIRFFGEKKPTHPSSTQNKFKKEKPPKKRKDEWKKDEV